MKSLLPFVALAVGACATPGAQPHEMSAAQHEAAAQQEEKSAAEHEAQYNPNANYSRERCAVHAQHASQGLGPEVCWTSTTNPTEQHKREAEQHLRHAADHRAGSAALRAAEESACSGIAEADRATSPFEHTDDIVDVAPLNLPAGTMKGTTTLRSAGASITFRAVPGMTAEWLQRLVDCHLARNAVLGNAQPEMPNCPLVPKGVSARVRSVGNGFTVEVGADDPATAKEVLQRAERLRGVTPVSVAPGNGR